MSEAAAQDQDAARRKKLGLTILALGTALIGLSLCLSGRTGIRHKLSFDHLREMIFGDAKEG